MDDTKIKEAFTRAKQDIEELRSYILYLTEQLEEIKRTLRQTNRQTDTPTYTSEIPTNNSFIPTQTPTDSKTPTDNLPQKALISQNNDISSGNRGVPTDRQTDRQTDQHTFLNPQFRPEAPEITLSASKIMQVSEMLDSLDDLKHELRRQFKSLTAQEMLVYTTIYQLEEEYIAVDYPLLAERLKLSESSIRDYILKITKKGIPLIKIKQDNKKVILSIPLELKKIASLQAILTLREL